MAEIGSETSIRQLLEKKTNDFLLCYEDATNANDPNLISRHLAPDCKRYFGPVGYLTAMGLPPDFGFSVPEYQAAYEQHMPIWAVKSTDILNVVIDEAGRKAAARSICHGEFCDGDKFALDFTWFLEFSEDGTEIKKVLEFVDIPESIRHFKKNQELLEKVKPESA
ncbi:hypothetical protein UCRPA7_2019 [Phaeoacremonium minimum UCRPA7]|uniref:SnoaL-like domain-containing protein n=1 Tax=Phaeoacremonium minimum (strain UCR-PA7) TaxID=1286976 RepID=R8BT51_PHAM7|nr:hypothetical protein UCRPA7_2019 [Phaeoacremonium minimum UCRPA7]EOO02479.1 hypothetical protein UCRPA7_2019 [Phaeoacremonium minimum UCRPA7]